MIIMRNLNMAQIKLQILSPFLEFSQQVLFCGTFFAHTHTTHILIFYVLIIKDIFFTHAVVLLLLLLCCYCCCYCCCVVVVLYTTIFCFCGVETTKSSFKAYSHDLIICIVLLLIAHVLYIFLATQQ